MRPNYSSKRDETRRRFVLGPSYTSGRTHFVHGALGLVRLSPFSPSTSSKLGQKSPNLDYSSSVGPNNSSKRDEARRRFVPGPSYSSGRMNFEHGALGLVRLSPFTPSKLPNECGRRKVSKFDYFLSVRPNYSSKRGETRRRFVPGPSYTSGRTHFIHGALGLVRLSPFSPSTSSKLGQKSPNLDYFLSVRPNYSSKRDETRGRFVPGPSYTSGRAHFIHGALGLVCLSPPSPSKLATCVRAAKSQQIWTISCP